jgi:hypothetical protein
MVKKRKHASMRKAIKEFEKVLRALKVKNAKSLDTFTLAMYEKLADHIGEMEGDRVYDEIRGKWEAGMFGWHELAQDPASFFQTIGEYFSKGVKSYYFDNGGDLHLFKYSSTECKKIIKKEIGKCVKIAATK